ncbi:MAG TPA: V-type ATP synthase subunit C, partial [Thermoanaerobacterales bacterium]|nr:V-type ATP synthase subunit C [Thermoanaerobacterales bacterium]
LLGRTVIERILDANGPEEALKVLCDTEYNNDIAEMDNIYDFEKVLEKSMARTINTLKESFKNHELINFFTVKNDYHNLKVIVKENIMGSEYNEYFSRLGEVSPSELRKYVEGDLRAKVPDNLKKVYHKAIEMYDTTKDPQQVDLVLDKALFEDMAEIAERANDKFLKEYLTALVDLTNIKTLVRLKKINADLRTLDSVLLPGGNLTQEFFEENFAGSTQDLMEALSSSPYYEVVEEGLMEWEASGSPSAFEKLLDNYLISLARRGLYKPFGSETVIGYMAARENELKILRILLVGKINSIPSDMIRERLRDVYV